MKPSYNLTIPQAAKLRGVTNQAVLKWIHDYGLKAKKIGRDWLIDPRDLAEFKPNRRGPKRKDEK